MWMSYRPKRIHRMIWHICVNSLEFTPGQKAGGESLENLAHVRYKSYSFPTTPLDSVSAMYNTHM